MMGCFIHLHLWESLQGWTKGLCLALEVQLPIGPQSLYGRGEAMSQLLLAVLESWQPKGNLLRTRRRQLNTHRGLSFP